MPTPLASPTPPRPIPPPAEVAHVKLQTVATGLHRPVSIAFEPGNAKKIYVVERGGRIRTVEKGVVAEKPFLDFSSRVTLDHPERGLLGLAFHPDFAKNGRFYLDFTDTKGDTAVVELSVVDGKIDPKSERRVLSQKQPYKNHNGGNLTFGPDGLLWIGLGDGGSGGDPHGNGQNDTTLLGKMIRVDVNRSDAKPEIFAKGLRNPWRFSFDRKTHDLWIADVGQDLWEEVDAVSSSAAGLNFGWNRMEGAHCFSPESGCDRTGLVLPLVEYGHAEGCSISGGYVYRGTALPQLDGLYFYADFCTAIVRSVRWKGGATAADSWEWRPVLDPDEQLGKIASFGEDPDGELYLVSLDGTIWKLVPR